MDAVERRLGLGDAGADQRIGARRGLQLGEGHEGGFGEQAPIGVDGVGGGVAAWWGLSGRGVEQGKPRGLDMLDGVLHQGLARGEVVQHRSPRQAGGLGDHGVAGAVIADLGEQPHCRVQDPLPRSARLGRILAGAFGHAGDMVRRNRNGAAQHAV